MKKMEQESKESVVDCTRTAAKQSRALRLGSNERMLGQRGISIILVPRRGWGVASANSRRRLVKRQHDPADAACSCLVDHVTRTNHQPLTVAS